MSGCPFCSIAAEESSAFRLYEDEHTLAFLDTEPATRGHTLVIPKEHHETLTDMEEALAGAVFQTVHRVAAALESQYHLDGENVVQANGSGAGQEIGHAHVHVIPRYEDDTVDLWWDREALDETVQREIATALRDELDTRE